MSKIGKKNILIPKESSIKIEGANLTITGPKGTKTLTINDKIFSSKLNESEFHFIEDLKDYLKTDNIGSEVYLLRNESRGKGVGFFEAGNFYPDFLLWQIKDGKEYLAFIEPHGLQHEGRGIKKIEFHKIIKEIQDRLIGSGVTLNSYIVSTTRFSKLNWGLSIDDLADMNVFFMIDNKDNYIKNIMKNMLK